MSWTVNTLRVVLWAIFRLVTTSLWCILTVPPACLAMLLTWNTDSSLWIARRIWSPFLLMLGGARLEVQGQEHVDPRRPTIYVANHQSTIDIPALLVALPVNLRFVCKSQLRWVPFLGWYLWLAKFVFIDRSNRQKAIRSLEIAGERIRSGINIVMYAEGTRSEDGRVLPFKKGPFALALKARVPVCPVTIEGSGKLMPKNSWKVTPGPIRVKIGAPIDTRPYSEDQREELMQRVRSIIIAQSLELGGRGGDLDDTVAATGQEGVGRAQQGAA